MNPLRESSGGKLLKKKIFKKKCDSRRRERLIRVCVFCITVELGFHGNTSNMPPQKHPDGQEVAHNTNAAVNYVPSPNNTKCTVLLMAPAATVRFSIVTHEFTPTQLHTPYVWGDFVHSCRWRRSCMPSFTVLGH